MAVLWNSPPTPWLDANGTPLTGGKAFFFDANTTTPMVTYTDPDLSIPHDHPVVANGAGMFPAVFLREQAYYRLRVEDQDAATIVDIDKISAPIITPPVIPEGDTPIELLFRTGDFKTRWDTGAHSGWVRANGRTIGDASSGGTERANADCEDLFLYLWPYTALTVSGGRGGSAAADWAASKTIALPDLRARAQVGLDGMGNGRANIVADALTSSTADTLGATAGASTVTLEITELPAHNHGGATGTTGAHSHQVGEPVLAGGGLGGTGLRQLAGGGIYANSNAGGDHSHTVSSQGGGDAHLNMQPSIFLPVYIKL